MKTTHVDILILGAGCAGLTAGIFSGRAGKQVLILENNIPGGQAALTTRIDNYPGIPHTDGFTLTQSMQQQARDAGAEILSCTVAQIWLEGKRVRTDRGDFTADAMILAAGAVPRELGIPGERAYRGKGVSYCASCDGFFYKGQKIYIVGGGNSACEEALYLADFGSEIHLFVRRDYLRCEESIAAQLRANPKIQVHFRRELTQIQGTHQPEVLVIRSCDTRELTTIPLTGKEGIFIFIGYRPASLPFRGQIQLDRDGYIITDERLQTSLPGVFAAGDIRQKELRQIVTAAADGAVAANSAIHFLRNPRKFFTKPEEE